MFSLEGSTVVVNVFRKNCIIYFVCVYMVILRKKLFFRNIDLEWFQIYAYSR